MITSAADQVKEEIEIFKRIPAIDNILEVICKTTGMGFAAVARVTAERWIACVVRDEINFGLKAGGELEIATTICHEIEESKKMVVIDNVLEDDQFRDHHTPRLYGFKSYISIPILRKDGSFYGTLCAIDPNPNRLNTAEITGMFKLFAELVSFHIHAVEQLDISEKNLLEEQKTAELREQFIAILGHDLRNPAGAVRNSAQLLLRMPLDDRAIRLANIIQDSSYRITGLIENMLDFARGRLGGGLSLNRNPDEQIAQVLTQVTTEMRSLHPQRTIALNISLSSPVNCDGKRVAQLYSNILGNAISYSPENTPVNVNVLSTPDQFTLCVKNEGNPIPHEKLQRLFQPFSRGEDKQNKEGLGLGLYISSEIANAHGGTLSVTSDDEYTCFTLTI
jgi:signal transduction histidine kinase